MKLNDLSKEQLIDIVKKLKQRKKFGLVWEDKSEDVVELCKKELPILEEIKDKEILSDESLPVNLLIEGDNYHALSVLNYTHAGKIDVIYIDPPYNTGNKDFKYNDVFVDREDSFRHSKWLSFMDRRLKLARNLLCQTGLLFISIDDNEQSQLKLLCDEIFGEENYINTISVNSKVSAGASGGGEDRRLKKNIEYILLYGKSVNAIQKMDTIYKETELMSYIRKMNEDNKSFKYTSVLYKKDNIKYYKTIKDGSGSDIVISKVNDYEIRNVKEVAKIEGITEEQVYHKYYDKIMTTTNAQTSIRTRVWDATDSDNTMYIASYVPKSGKNKGKKNEIILMGKQKVLVIWLADTSYKDNSKIFKKEKIGTYWDGFSWINVSKEGGIKFDNGKKPIKLVKQVISLYSAKSDMWVLDFFAGSGTTGHAVLELNKEDGGNRKFILCTNNENKIAEEICYPRVKKIIAGYTDVMSIPANLKYFKTSFVKKSTVTDDTRGELVNKSVKMICVKEGTFKEVANYVDFKVYKDSKHSAGILLNLEKISSLKETLDGLKLPSNIYVFSLTNDTYNSDFEDLSVKHKLCPIPESILEVYRKLFKE